MAEAFAEAEEENGIMLIDEVDTFLFDRSGASRSWEITQVNEFLTQLEQFRGGVRDNKPSGRFGCGRITAFCIQTQI